MDYRKEEGAGARLPGGGGTREGDTANFSAKAPLALTGKSAGPTEPVAPFDPARPVDHIDIAESVKPIEPGNNADPVEPAAATDLFEPIEPIEPINGGSSIARIDNGKSDDLAEPNDPVEPADSVEPGGADDLADLDTLFAEPYDPALPEKNTVRGGVLILVATPIGNLADLSPRARKVLSRADLIAAEDTRTAAALLARYGIRGRPMQPYHAHNARSSGQALLRKLREGRSVALVCDAGTPAISDPGEDLVRLCAQSGVPVTAVPGCCAALDALVLSGLPTRRFVFEGFLPEGGRERRERLAALSREERTSILYLSPHKLGRDLRDLLGALGDRPAALCRELTKRNEEILRAPLSTLAEMHDPASPGARAGRGEYVLVLGGAAPEEEKPAYPASPREHLRVYLGQGLPRMDAMKAAARDRGISKSDFYALLLSEEEK